MENITQSIKLIPHYRHQGTVFNCIILEHDQYRYFLSCGSQDAIYAFKQGVGVYVLNVNESKGYIGLNSFMGLGPYAINSVFIHTLDDVEVSLGADWRTLEPELIAAKLLDYLY